MSDKVLYEVQGRAGVITLNRPDARNAVNGDVASGIEAAIDQLENDQEVWVGILRANSEGQDKPVFCAGADLKAINSGSAGGLNTERGGFAGFVYRERTKPIIVAVDGLATAGGCEIVLAADLVVATTRSSFGLAEVKRNLIAGAGGLFRLPRAIGQAAAMEMILTGEPLPAPRAYELGLVSRLVEPGQAFDEAMKLAAQVALAAPMAVAESRKVVLAAASADDETLKKMTNRAMATVMSSEDIKEGLVAFIEKRAGVEEPLTGQTIRFDTTSLRAVTPARSNRFLVSRSPGRAHDSTAVAPRSRRRAIAAASSSSPNPTSRASGSRYTWRTCPVGEPCGWWRWR